MTGVGQEGKQKEIDLWKDHCVTFGSGVLVGEGRWGEGAQGTVHHETVTGVRGPVQGWGDRHVRKERTPREGADYVDRRRKRARRSRDGSGSGFRQKRLRSNNGYDIGDSSGRGVHRETGTTTTEPPVTIEPTGWELDEGRSRLTGATHKGNDTDVSCK